MKAVLALAGIALLSVCGFAGRAAGQAAPLPDPPPVEMDAPVGPAEPPEGHLVPGTVTPSAPALPPAESRDAFPDSSVRRLTPAELAGADEGTLCLAALEIFARHGVWPDVPFIVRYFWRREGYPPPAHEKPQLNEIEQANLEAIERAELERFASGRTAPAPTSATPESSFKAQLLAHRAVARERSCRANMKTILGAIEMYNLDKRTRRTQLTPEFFGDLLSGGYLQGRYTDPGQGPGTESHYYVIDEGAKRDLRIGCRVHGELIDPAAEEARRRFGR